MRPSCFAFFSAICEPCTALTRTVLRYAAPRPPRACLLALRLHPAADLRYCLLHCNRRRYARAKNPALHYTAFDFHKQCGAANYGRWGAHARLSGMCCQGSYIGCK